MTALANALLQVITALSLALLTTFLTSRPSYKAGQRLLNQLQIQARTTAVQVQDAGHTSVAAHTTLPAPIAALFLHAYDDTFVLLAIMGLIAGLLGLALRRQSAVQRAAVLNEVEAAPEHLLLAG